MSLYFKRNSDFATNSKFLIPVSLQPDRGWCKPLLFDLTGIVWNMKEERLGCKKIIGVFGENSVTLMSLIVWHHLLKSTDFLPFK